mmetsp:Transcript_166903/g.535763  ORF Transcript_166903/g.535763 Transcript_166903/m.535763 type:complete len:214 (+) Transcript_166903:831-1472(+)
MDMSASLLNLVASMTAVVRQIMRKKSPLFLLAYPWNSSMTPCTISAIWLTKVMTLDWSTSVAVPKSRIRVAPMIHSTRMPSIIASTHALSTPFMLCSMMDAPAWPKPSASKEPNLMMVFSRMTVSMSSAGPSLPLHIMISLKNWKGPLFASNFRVLALVISSILNSSSATFIAAKGLSRMVSTLAIMFSTGCSTRRLASPAKTMEAAQRDTQM